MQFRITKIITTGNRDVSGKVFDGLAGQVVTIHHMEPEEQVTMFDETDTELLHMTQSVEVIDAFWDTEARIGIQTKDYIYRLARIDGGPSLSLPQAMSQAGSDLYPTFAYRDEDTDMVYHLFYDPEHSGYHLVERINGYEYATNVIPAKGWRHVDHVIGAIPMGRGASLCNDMSITHL